MAAMRRCVPILIGILACSMAPASEPAQAKPGPDEALEILKAGNERFISGRSEHPHADLARIKLAGSASQADHAYATVLTCSDSRIPIERIFDAGVMDLFVIRVAGNVCNTDEIGSIEYGLAHVKTPVLVILGHTQCGAVTAVAQHLQGKGHALERNIPPLVKSIEPAVRRVLRDNAGLESGLLISKGIEENVWSGIENLFLASPAVRELAAQDKVKVVGGIYDVGTGRVAWLPENKVHRLLGRVEADPNRARNAMADHGDDTHGATPAPDAHGTHGASPVPASPHAPAVEHKASAISHAKKDSKVHGAHAEEPGESAMSAVPKGDGRPWPLIAAAGGVFLLGAAVAFFAHLSGKKAGAALHAPAAAH